MKTSGMEVLCDGCGAVIPVLHPTAIFATLKGPTIRHKKLDCCNTTCLAMWASAHGNDGLAGAVPNEPPAKAPPVLDLMQALKDSLRASHTPTPEPPQ